LCSSLSIDNDSNHIVRRSAFAQIREGDDERLMRRHHRTFILVFALIGLVGSLIITPTSAVANNEEFPERIPVPSPDMPIWTEQPQNQTLEYGDNFEYQVNLTGGLGYWWFVSDTLHFRINGGVASDHATIRSNGILNIGVYYLRITIWDQTYDRLEAEIWITVEDTIYPEVQGPDDLEFIEGERDHNLTWVAYDNNPYYYSVTRNGATIDEGHWLEPLQVFSISIGFLPSGTYQYELTIWDNGDNSVESGVLVHVRQNGTRTSSTEPDPYARTGEIERIVYVPKPDILFIEVFAIVVISGLAGLVMISAVATKKHELGFSYD
jgi:hypothetical protein